MTSSPRPTLHFPPFRLPPDVDLLYRGETVVPLEPQAVRVLRYLAENHDRVVSKEELLERIWPDVFTTDGVLKKAISQARRALGDDAGDSRFIATYHGRGYRFIHPVQTEAAAAAEPPPVADPDYDQLIGRDAELSLLCAEYRRTLEGNGRPVLVFGETGIGKTQLARHFQRWARAQGATCLYARFFEYRGNRREPYEIFLDLLRVALGVPEGEPWIEPRKMVEARCGVTLPEEIFLAAGGSPGPSRVRGSTGAFAPDHSRVVVPLSRCFRRLSRERPLVLVCDDLQWADGASRDLLGYLMRTIEDEPLMILALVRRGGTVDPAHPLTEWLRAQASYRSYTALTLRPLDEAACRATIEAIFGGPSSAPPLSGPDLQRLYRMTGGNPYFLTEMLRLLVAEGAITRGAGAETRWQWRGMEDMQLPDTIVMAAQAKLERLSMPVREVVTQAAVLGDEFRVATLSRMAGRDEEEIVTLLAEGVRRGVLAETGLSAGEDCRFYHTTLRRALYHGLPLHQRRTLHAHAAAAIAEVYAPEVDRLAAILSAHYEEAGLPEPTVAWSLRAWRGARSRWNWPEAVACLERARRALGQLEQRGEPEASTAERLTLLLGLGEGYSSVGRLKDSEAVLGEARPLAEALGDRAALAAALLQQGQTRLGLSLYREANELARQALAIYHEAGDREGEAHARIQLCAGEAALGEFEAIAPLLDRLAHESASTPLGIVAHSLIGWARVLQGRYIEGAALLERALEEQERTGDLRQCALLRRRIAWAHLSRGDYERAVALATRAREEYLQVGDALGEARANLEVGLARIAQGLGEEGIECLGRTLDRLRAMGDAHGEAEAFWALGRAHGEAGRPAQAETMLHRALEMLGVIGDRDDQARVLVDLARLQLSGGDAASALRTARDAVTVAEGLGASDRLGEALTERARAALALGQAAEARQDSRRAAELLEMTGSGEAWRAHWADARAAEAAGEAPATVIDGLKRAVALLAAQRAQFEAKDETRRLAFTRARAGPARDLRDRLNSLGRTEEAASLAAEWFPDERTTSGRPA